MTQITNDYIYEICGGQGFSEGDNISLFAGAGLTASTGYPIRAQLHRVTTAIANAALVLPSIMTNADNAPLIIIVNDSAQTVKVFPFLGPSPDNTENINGVATGFSITSVTSAVFFASLVQLKRKGGSGSTTPALNWSAALFS